MSSEDSKTLAPPFISFRTFINLLDRLESGGIPQRLDRGYWGVFLAGGVGQQLMHALRFLGLIDGANGEPTPLLESLVPREQRKPALAALLRDRYAPVFDGADLSRTALHHMDEVFRKEYKLAAETQRKAVTFFVHAAQHADIPLSSWITSKLRQPTAAPKGGGRATARRRPSNAAAPSPTVAEPSPPATVPVANPTPQTRVTKTIRSQSGADVTLTISVDWFEVDAEERQALLDLIDQLRTYEQQFVIAPLDGLTAEGDEQESL